MIRVELLKLLRRPRTWVAVGLLCMLPVLVAIFVATSHLAPPPGKGPAFLSAVLNNGSLYPAAGMPLTNGELALRVLATVGFVTVSMIGLAAIALFFSTLTDSSLGAALGALSVMITSDVLVTLDAAKVVQPYLPTRYWLAWVDFYRDPVFWRDIERGLLLQ